MHSPKDRQKHDDFRKSSYCLDFFDLCLGVRRSLRASRPETMAVQPACLLMMAGS